MTWQTIRCEKESGLARIILNRPAQMNAISPQVLQELWEVAEEIENDPAVRVVTITGAGRAFCTGADLQAVKQIIMEEPEKVEAFLRFWHRVFNRIEDLSKPVIAGVHGLALAGGLELMMVCDLAVADEEAKLGDQHANFGLVAGGGGSQRLPRLIGPRRAKELMLTGNWLSAQEALALGLINRVAPAGRLTETLKELSDQLLEKSLTASRAVKGLINKGMQVDLRSGLEMEILAVKDHFRSADFREGVSAFAEKRKPVFGR